MKRYIGNTGEMYLVNDNAVSEAASPESNANEASPGSILGNLFGTSRRNGRLTNLPFGIEIGDLAVLALLFFLYRESGDEEFLIILICFAICILSRQA